MSFLGTVVSVVLIGASSQRSVSAPSVEDAVVDSIPWIWLQCVGIDRSTNYRGVAVVPLEIADKVRNLNVAVYRPVTRSYKR